MAEYQGRKVTLDKPRRIQKGDTGYGKSKFEVFVKDGERVKRVPFGSPTMSIKRQSPKNRKSFRARFKCDKNPPKDKTKARYWSCKMWQSGKSVSDMLK
ncbi:MAG: hypothetical protein Unbinned2716contig1004_20 [Prokaryotic dsDNA virus sp.]|jgi:hypothetical protein|nr:MAG: hypothetical protein Unbinned2716contig1004_20 [Prokaryotic dsDNA virus sp.]|tara:strand:- start:13925 stop:14221 length:297 start_codon:yes stop_codon:yes gene_type:complete